MPVDPDDLAVAALRGTGTGREEPGGDRPPTAPLDDRDLAELVSLRHVVAVGRSVRELDRERTTPPSDLWTRIEAEVFDAGTTSEDLPALGADPPAPGGDVVDLASVRGVRRPRRAPLLAVAAAAAVLLGALGVWTLAAQPAGDELVASTDLSLLAGDGSGRAELHRRDDGVHLVVEVAELSPAQEADFYELWLLTADGGDPQSMMKFDRSEGRLDVLIPAGMDTSRFPVVDISEELDDGDDTHSGISILRGSFV